MAHTNERPKVLVLASTVPSRPGDGTPEFVLSLSRALSDLYDVTILCPSMRGAPPELQVDGLTIRRFRYFPRRLQGLADGAIIQTLKAEPWRIVEVPFFLVAFAFRALKLSRELRADLVHAHWIIPGGLVALFVKALTGVPYVVTAHGVDVFGLRARPFRWLKRLVMRHASSTSPASREMGILLGIPDDGLDDLVVPMGVDAERIRSAVGTRQPQRGRFLFVGRLADKKGVDILIRALADVPGSRLVILGDGPERKRLEMLSTGLELSDRVEFRGQATADDVVNELRLAFCTIVPSRVGSGGDADSTPLTMSESMAAKVPVIASRIGGLAESITSGENGLLVEPDSPTDLAAAMDRLMSASDEEIDKLTTAAWRRMRDRLDIRHTKDRYDAFFREALGGRRGS